jgi:hypothetical protein
MSCYNNQLTILPKLPPTLKTLICDYNNLTSLPTLPDTLKNMWCTNNQLTILPKLPPTLESLYCNYNNLTALPPLPPTLTTLCCNYNNLTSLPTLPDKLIILNCQNNQLTILPTLPDTLEQLKCGSNPYNTIFANLVKKYDLNRLFIDNDCRQIISIRKYYQIIINAKNIIPLQIALYKVISCDIPLDCFSIIGSYLSGEKGTLSTQISNLRYKMY